MKAPERLAQVRATVRRMLVDPDRSIQQHNVLELEYAHLHGGLPDGYPTDGPDAQGRLESIHAAIHLHNHSALCLSGGGIRSASFAVGVLQGMARRGMLSSFDYLSTVSGGGYTGGWLSAWLFHARTNGMDAATVFEALSGGSASVAVPEPEPIRRIREYSYYLDPKFGPLSVDVWALIATVIRNLVLNWLVLIPLLTAALLVPRLYFAIVMLGTQDWIDRAGLMWWSLWLALVGSGLLAVSLGYIVLDLPSVGNRQRGQQAFLGISFGPMLLSTAAFTLYWAWSRALDANPVTLRGLVGLGAGAHTAIWVLVGLVSRRRWRPLTWFAALISGAVAGLGAWWFAVHWFARPLARGDIFAGVSVPVILGILGGAGTLFVGVASSETSDDDREWWSRFGAWLLIAATGWLITSGVVFVGPALMARVVALLSAEVSSPTVAKTLVGALTALTGWITAMTGREARNPAKEIPLPQRIAFALAAPAFVVLLLMLLASLNLALLAAIHSLQVLPEYAHQPGGGLPEILTLLIALIGLGTMMGRFVGVNKFSLHGMYRNRLIRAFLGASRPKESRRPNRFSGFDPNDNIFLRELVGTRRPLHVINMALNLVADNRLAWQERKAESFTVSPLAAGTCGLGYRPIAEYGGPDGMSLGTALTISGAAASPNMGYHSSPAMTFLLTLFNARLGAWMGNPGDAGRFTWRRRDPVVGAGPLVRELFGRTSDRNPYVYLSDGGHFDNLGLYEMVARRCRYIVVSDAGCDPNYTFEDLGNAMRKIRIDLGIPIEFPNGLAINGERAATSRHGAIGRIKYSSVDGPVEDGVIIYLKATLSGDEPQDVKNYAAAHPEFPHESTANQWFGESQFESYRMLGLHTVDAVAGECAGRAGLAEFVDAIAANPK